MEKLPPPSTEEELYRRTYRLSGLPLAQLALLYGVEIPGDLRKNKGWVGQLLEVALGATGASQAVQDFPHLGVEMKTLPVDPHGRPRESTFVCVAPLDGGLEPTWERSWVRRKLSRVLWVPVVSADGVPLALRRVGAPLLWSPSPEEEALLRGDWEAIAEQIHAGAGYKVSARLGEALQLRPKAAHSGVLIWAQDEEANWILVNPRGFYLRAGFTRDLLARHFALP